MAQQVQVKLLEEDDDYCLQRQGQEDDEEEKLLEEDRMDDLLDEENCDINLNNEYKMKILQFNQDIQASSKKPQLIDEFKTPQF